MPSQQLCSGEGTLWKGWWGTLGSRSLKASLADQADGTGGQGRGLARLRRWVGKGRDPAPPAQQASRKKQACFEATEAAAARAGERPGVPLSPRGKRRSLPLRLQVPLALRGWDGIRGSPGDLARASDQLLGWKIPGEKAGQGRGAPAGEVCRDTGSLC